MDELDSRLALWRAPGVGPVRFAELLKRYGSAAAVFAAGPRDGALPETLRAYLREPDTAAVAADRAWAAGEDCRVLCFDDPDYPPLLAQIPDPPPLLFLRGDPAALAGPNLAVVGSRNPSRSGADTARDFARHLAAVGLGVVSGLALGIDAAAHQGALDRDGTTVAVLGTGPDRVYPARNRDLARAIVAAGGALVSEFPPGTPPSPGNFPRRNRIISGLSLGTLVVEAALRSGSLITARVASEQGREVFAVPGSIHNPLARGCHRLIRDGAKLVETARDILEELAPQLAQLIRDDVAEAPGEDTEKRLDEPHRTLLQCVDHAPTPVDVLVERSGLTADVVSSMLLSLELEGYLTSTAGGFTRTSKRV